MAQVLLIDDDLGTLMTFGATLKSAGHAVVCAASAVEGLDRFVRRSIDIAISDLRLPDLSGLEVLRTVRRHHFCTPFVFVTAFPTPKDEVVAMRMGASDFVSKPLKCERLLRLVDASLGSRTVADGAADEWQPGQEAHAAARWARAVVPILDSPTDLRTIAEWARRVAASRGTLRNWCRTAGLGPRRSLLFGRFLRAIVLGERLHVAPSTLLDVTDRRTLDRLLRSAGLSGGFAWIAEAFLEHQTLVTDVEALFEFRTAFEARQRTLSNPLHAR